MSEIDREHASARERAPVTRHRLSRRDLLTLGIGVALGGGALAGLSRLGSSDRTGEQTLEPAGADPKWRHPARHYQRRSKGFVQCTLCPKQCYVGAGGRGYCEVRENQGGEYYTLVYGRAASVNVDPIEKKPFFHVLPGSPVFSFATAGCNFECKNCQNWQLSQARPEELPAQDLPPAKLVEAARRQGCRLIAGTYNEPTVFFEYLQDVAAEGNERGVRTTMVSAGYISREPMLELCRVLAAVKIDLKSMREKFYQANCEGTLKPVLDTIELVKGQGVWLEIVYLVIPTLNDSEKEIRDLARWVRANVGADVPLHFSRFQPAYRLKQLPPTPYETLDRCHKAARAEGLHYVYVGNIAHAAESTFCPNCGKVVIGRQGYRITGNHLRDGRCEFCQHPIPGIWS